MIRAIKKFLKSSQGAKNFLAFVIKLYLRLVYATTTWRYFFPNTDTEHQWLSAKRTIAITWHDKLAILPHEILHFGKKMHILVSPHSDGAIIASILGSLGFSIIHGSTNKDATQAIKEIIKALKNEHNLSLTPDGPRGPRHRINSNILAIGKKCEANIVCVSCVPTKYFRLKSWDKLIIPFPFGTINVYYSHIMALDAKSNITNSDLQSIMDRLTAGATPHDPLL